MDFAPFFQANLAVQIHVIAALFAAPTGIAIFMMRKGTRRHKMIGRAWFTAMAIIAISSFGIQQIKVWGGFSPLHLLSILTLVTLCTSIVAARHGNIGAHRSSLISLFVGGIGVAGAIAFSRGLLMSRIVFPETGGFLPTPQDLPGGPVAFAFGLALLVVLVTFAFEFRSRKRRSVSARQ